MAWAERLDALAADALAGGLEVRHARSFAQRGRGLAGLDDLPATVGLRIHRCRSVHTFGMRFALDLLWLGRDGDVVRVDRDVPRRRRRGCRRARSVLEVRAGAADAFRAALDHDGRHAGGSGYDPGVDH